MAQIWLHSPIGPIARIMRRCSADAPGGLVATLDQAGMLSACPPLVYGWNWKIMKNAYAFNLRHLLLIPLLAVLAACGGGGGSASSGTTTTPTLVSIAVTPANLTMAIGTTQQFVATGTFTDSSTSALSTGLTWRVKGSNITIGTTGIVTGKAVGPDTVTATVGTVVGSTPVTVNAPWRKVAAGGAHTVALKADGSLFSWGSNLQGQLGDGTNTDRVAPVQVQVTAPTTGTISPWTMVAAGEEHTVALRADGTLWAWGDNSSGQVGNGSLVDLHAPLQIGTSTWRAVAAGTLHSVAILADGALFAWGSNGNGQVGNGLSTNATAPTQISKTNPSNWTAISAGAAYTVGVRTDGTLWAWGSNSDGQLGDGFGLDTNTPNQIGTVTNWSSALSAGLFHAFGIRSDGTLWGWGRNVEGQQGNGDATGAAVPTPVNLP